MLAHAQGTIDLRGRAVRPHEAQGLGHTLETRPVDGRAVDAQDAENRTHRARLNARGWGMIGRFN